MSEEPVVRPAGSDRAGGRFARFSALGPSAQAAIPGIYAWAVTVAPAAWARGAPLVAKAAALTGIVALLFAPAFELTGKSEAKARLVSLWGVVLSSGLVWALAPPGVSAAMDGGRGVLGVVGWGLFAFASAGPTLKPVSDPRAKVTRTGLAPRSALRSGDGVYLVLAGGAAVWMQAVGWSVAPVERAVLVRLVTLTGGIAVLSAATSIALSRHLPVLPGSRRRRMVRALPWIVLLAILGAVRLALVAR